MTHTHQNNSSTSITPPALDLEALRPELEALAKATVDKTLHQARETRTRFSEEQIIGILKEHQAGMTPAELCRKHGISDATFYTWRKKYGGMDVSDAKRLKALEEENAKLKRLLAEQMMDVSTLREMLTKNF